MRWVLALALLCMSVSFALEPNLLTNGNFEADTDKDGVADDWFAEIHRNEGGEGYFAVDANVKVQGKFCQQIVHTSEKGWVRVSQDGISAKPNSLYLFRCWVKANCRFLLILYAFKGDGSYDTFIIAQGRGTGDEERKSGWQLFSGVVKTPVDARAFKVSLVAESKGEAWFDDAQLLLIERPIYAFVPIISVGLSCGLSEKISSSGSLKPALTISLDGDLSEECWQNAEPLTPFLELGTGKVAEPSTIAKVLATQNHLLIAFHCDEPNPQGMKLKTPESGEPAYMDDCVEVYLDPQHSHSGFLQFVVTPKGNKWAQQFESAVWAKVWWLLPRPTQRLITKGWQAATKVGKDFWSAEIAIPFELLGIKPKAGQTIGINLCRSRKVGQEAQDKVQGEQNSAFAYFAERTFQRPEKFPHIVLRDWGLGIRDWRKTPSESRATARPKNLGSMAKPASDQSQATSQYLQVGSWSSRRAGKLLTQSKNDWSSLTAKLTPKPQRIFVRNGQVKIDKNVIVILPDGATEFDRTAAELLIDTLKRLGFEKVRLLTSHNYRLNAIALSTLDKLPANLRPKLPIGKLRKFFAQRGEEAYAIFVGMGDKGRGTRKHSLLRTSHLALRTVVVGSSPRGVFNGVQTLRQILFLANAQSQISSPKSPVPDAITLPACEIWDYPDLKLRGWHFIAPLKHELTFAEKLLDWFALMKFNTLVIEVDDRFPYERHPEIAHPQSLTKTQWQQFLAKARGLGFEIIPQVQTFGHFGYVLNKPKYRHLSELKEPHPRWGFFAYCPSEPETYKVVFDLFDEVLEVFKPRWFHIGHDEITFVPIGVCDRCKRTGKTAWQLLAEDIRKLYDYLKAKGIERVGMWCDQLESDRTGGYPPYFTHFASDLIPKDIVQFCWHYDARQTFPWLTRLKDKGFDVIACGWYHPQNVWRFAAESFDRRALGYCGTTWYGVTGFATQVDLMTAVVLGAQNSWSVENPQIEFASHPTNIAQDLWAIVGERTRWKEGMTEFVCVDLSPFANASLTSWGSEGLVPYRCTELERASSEIWSDGVPFRLVKVPNAPPQVVALSSDSTSHEVTPDLVAVPIKAKAEAIYLLLTTTARPIRTEDMYQRGRTDPRKVATLAVRYADGSEKRVELLYRRHLTEWNDRIGCSHARIVWQGKTERGYLLNLCAYKWLNSKPDVPIAEVTILSSASSVQPVLVALTISRFSS